MRLLPEERIAEPVEITLRICKASELKCQRPRSNNNIRQEKTRYTFSIYESWVVPAGVALL